MGRRVKTHSNPNTIIMKTNIVKHAEAKTLSAGAGNKRETEMAGIAVASDFCRARCRRM